MALIKLLACYVSLCIRVEAVSEGGHVSSMLASGSMYWTSWLYILDLLVRGLSWEPES